MIHTLLYHSIFQTYGQAGMSVRVDPAVHTGAVGPAVESSKLEKTVTAIQLMEPALLSRPRR